MSDLKKRYLVSIFLLLMTSVFLLVYQNKSQAIINRANIFEIPLELGEWKGQEFATEEEVRNILETESVLMRRYTNKED